MKQMIRNALCVCALALGASVALAPATFAQQVNSLRGAEVSAPELEPGSFRNLPDGPPLQRDYIQQPPLIPHKVDGYQITTSFNKCMDCHSWTRYRAAGATKVSLTHFRDRESNELSNISPRRYFCLQCHVSQTDARPLVDNTFRSATGVR